MLDERILKFIKKEHLASICVIKDDGTPHAFSAFYAFNSDEISLFIASDENTEHIKAIKNHPEISGTIALNTLIVGKIRGVQFNGTISVAEDVEIYFKRFVFARSMNAKIYKILLKSIKFTDNTLGFGTKILWQRS